MNGVTLNFDANSVAPNVPMDPVPSGWYNAKIVESSLEPTSKPGGQLLKLTLDVLDGQYAGRKLYDRLNLVNENPVAVEIAFKTLSSICRATGVMKCDVSTQLHGIPMKVKVKLRPPQTTTDGKQYDSSNEIRGYDTINSDHNTDAAVVPGVAGAPGGMPPWAASIAPVAAAATAAPLAAPAYTPPVAAAVPTAPQPWPQPGAAAAPAYTLPAAVTAAPVAAPAAPAAPLAPPPPQVAVATGPVMLPGANGIPYESYKTQGWTDEAMIARGIIAAPAAPVMPGTAPQPASTANATPPWAR